MSWDDTRWVEKNRWDEIKGDKIRFHWSGD